jgi:osmotically-inducible protein OsmY
VASDEFFEVKMTTQQTLSERVGSAITTSPYLGRRQLRFETDGGRVILKGVVKTYFQKQMAQEVVRRVEGVERVDNNLEVHWPPV